MRFGERSEMERPEMESERERDDTKEIESERETKAVYNKFVTLKKNYKIFVQSCLY